MPHAQKLAQPPGLIELARRIGLGIRRHEQGPLAQRVLRGAREQGRVDAAREGDDDALHLAQDAYQTVVLGLRHTIYCRARVTAARTYGSTRIRSWKAV